MSNKMMRNLTKFVKRQISLMFDSPSAPVVLEAVAVSVLGGAVVFWCLAAGEGVTVVVADLLCWSSSGLSDIFCLLGSGDGISATAGLLVCLV